MPDFTKTIRLGTVDLQDGRADRANVFCKIRFTDGKLSISGVEGPLRNGDARGSCGQINSHLTAGEIVPAPGWTPEMIARFLDVWGEWHLNDMHPYTAAMKAAGWRELAQTPMFGHKFTLTIEAINESNAAEKLAMAALKSGATFTPTPEQSAAAARPYSFTVWTRADEAAPEPPAHYQRARHIGGHNNGDLERPESKTLGWLRPSEHPDGLLTRQLEGEGYGSKWYREEVPADVVEWLRGLPKTDLTPAWV